MTIVTRSALSGGWRAALRTTLDINLGLLIWALAAAFGVAAVIAASETAFTVLKLVGAAYLVPLGALALGSASTPQAEAFRETDRPFRRHSILARSVGSRSFTTSSASFGCRCTRES